MDYDYLTSSVRVTIPTFKSDGGTVYYAIELESDDNKWYIEKRFSEFDNLMKELKNYHSLPALPGKSFFKMNDKELENRRKGLETFLQKIVTRNDLMNSDPIKFFLQLDKNASEMMVNPPKLGVEYFVEGQSKGIRDFYYNIEEQMFYIATADMNPMSKFKSNMSNTKLPWENEGGKSIMEVGTIEGWSCAGSEMGSKFQKIWSKAYPKEAVSVHYDKASNRVFVGLDDGVIDVIQLTKNGYEDLVCVKAHKDRVVGLAYDAMSNVVYSASHDKVLRVSHGSSLALIVGVPHKESIFSMLRDTLNKRIFFGTKHGEVYIYDISQAEKPRLLTVLNNNKKGSIRSLHLDTNRNYLFTGSYDDG